MRTIKDPIRLRSREIKDGNKSLYLDIYMDGRRRYEYLKLYLVPEKNAKDKAKNRETLRLAEAIRAQRIVEFQNGRFGFDRSERLDMNFFDYFDRVVESKKKLSQSTSHHNFEACRRHLVKYCGRETVTLREVDEKFCEGFIVYLQSANKLNTLKPTPLSPNGRNMYYCKFRTIMNQAVKDGVISRSPLEYIRGIKKEESERQYLTIEELRAMVKTECHYPIVKQTFLFACLTGLRKSDVVSLEWRDLAKVDDLWRITFRQVKTRGLQYLDISDEARSYMGDKPENAAPTDKIFKDFYYSDKTNLALREWAADAGVHKKITFHSSRHTFAVLLLSQSTDIYTVSKLLGHADVKTTMIYSHILDSKKQDAIRSLPKLSLED